MYIYVAAVNEKGGHEFVRELKRIHGGILRKEREGGNNVIIL